MVRVVVRVVVKVGVGAEVGVGVRLKSESFYCNWWIQLEFEGFDRHYRVSIIFKLTRVFRNEHNCGLMFSERSTLS